jgi:hypothetical protein
VLNGILPASATDRTHWRKAKPIDDLRLGGDGNIAQVLMGLRWAYSTDTLGALTHPWWSATKIFQELTFVLHNCPHFS